MTGLENITQKILDEAEEKARKIIESANAQVEQIIDSADEEIKIKQAQMRLAAEQKAVVSAQRMIAAANLEGKKDYLSAKQEMIDTAFAKAVSKLASLEDAEYDELIKDMSRNVSGEIITLSRDKAKGIGGGFVAKNGNVEFNFSFEALAKNAKERLEKDLVSMLFI